MATVSRLATTIHLPEVDEPHEAVEISDAVRFLTELPAWKYIEDAIAAKVEHLRLELTNKPVRADAADYERTIGQMIGLESVDGIVAGIHKRAEEATNGR